MVDTAQPTEQDGADAFYELAATTLRDAAVDLLESYGGKPIEVEPPGACPRSNLVLAAAVGFAGPAVHGTLAVALPRPLLDRLSPLDRVGPGAVIHSDWIGELGNQLLGRVKNKLVSYGVDMRLGTPAVFEGRELQLVTADERRIEQRIRCGADVVYLWLGARVSEGFVLERSSAASADEGSVLLF